MSQARLIGGVITFVIVTGGMYWYLGKKAPSKGLRAAVSIGTGLVLGAVLAFVKGRSGS